MKNIKLLLRITSVYMTDIISDINDKQDVVDNVVAILGDGARELAGQAWSDLHRCPCNGLLDRKHECTICHEVCEKSYLQARVNQISGYFHKMIKATQEPEEPPVSNVSWD